MKKTPITLNQRFSRLLKTRPLLILLDYDGTLTDFKKNPEHSRISSSTRELLYRLHRKHDVIMVTGRYIDSLEKVSGLRGIPVVGTHGFEARRLPGRLRFASASLQNRFKKEAARLWQKVKLLHEKYPGIHIEKKPFSSTLHFRGGNLSPLQVRRLTDEFKSLFKRSVTPGIWTLKDGKKMIEAMPRGFSKGKSVRKILKKFPKHFPLYAGDDLGDISVLKLLKNKGLRIAVGNRVPKHHWDIRFKNPGQFTAWLKKLS